MVAVCMSLTAVIVYFPFSFILIYRHIPGEWANFMEISSLLLMPWVLGTALTVIISDSKRQKNTILLVTCLFLICMWNTGRHLPDWETDLDFYYRIPKEAIEIGDYIKDENAGFFSEDKHNIVKVLVLSCASDFESEDDRDPDYTYIQYRIGNSLRQYLSPVYIEPENVDPNKPIAIKDINTYDYVLCVQDSEAITYLLDNGFYQIRDYDGFSFLGQLDE